jgi:hypothetical protein
MKTLSELKDYAYLLLDRLDKGTLSSADVVGHTSVCHLILKLELAEHQIEQDRNGDGSGPVKVVAVRPHKRSLPDGVYSHLEHSK